MPSSVPSDGVVFFLMQNQTSYTNVVAAGCEPPRGNNASALVGQCRMGQGAVVYTYDEGGTVFPVNGCDYSFIGYAPCVPDEATSTSTVALEATVPCVDIPNKTTDPTAFQKFVQEYEANVTSDLINNGVGIPTVTVTQLCSQPVAGGLVSTLAQDTLASVSANRRLQDGTAKYAVVAEQTTECGDSCANQDFSATEAALVEAISSASPGTKTTSASSVTELASTEPSAQPSVSSAPSISSMPSSQPSVNPSMNPSVSAQPSSMPSESPSTVPSDNPSVSAQPSSMPSESPSTVPSESSSVMPSETPSMMPSESTSPSFTPTSNPLTNVTNAPTKAPTNADTLSPTKAPTNTQTNNPTNQGDTLSPTATPVIVVADIMVRGNITFSPSIFGRRLEGSSNCQSEEFVVAVQVSLEDIIRGTLQANEQLVSLTVSTEQSASCVFPFVAKVRNTQTCTDGSSCDAAAISQAAGQSVASNIETTVTTSAADTTDNGLLRKIASEGGDTSGLTGASANIDESTFEVTTSTGVTIRIDIHTDDHPAETSWTIVDTCQGGGDIATGGGYTVKNKLESTSISARNGRYMFSILDAGLDGICCNNGGPGSYKVYVDNELQVSGGEFGPSEFKLFGDCSGQTVTSKPTNNLVCVTLVCSNFCV